MHAVHEDSAIPGQGARCLGNRSCKVIDAGGEAEGNDALETAVTERKRRRVSSNNGALTTLRPFQLIRRRVDTDHISARVAQHIEVQAGTTSEIEASPLPQTQQSRDRFAAARDRR